MASKVRRVEFDAPQQSYSEVGAFGLPFAEAYKDMWRLTRPMSAGVTVAQLMTMRRTDGQARSLNRLLTHPILAALDNAKVLKPKSGGAAETKFCENALYLPYQGGGMLTTFRKFIAQVLLALNDGFAPFEIVPYVPETGPLKGKWTFRKLAYRPANTVSFLVDENDEFAGFNQRTVHNNQLIDVDIERTYAMYYAAQEEEAPFYGRSYLEAAYKHYDKKEKLYYLMHLAAQRAAVGTRVGKYPKGGMNNKKFAEFKNALADLRSAGYAMIPEDHEIDNLHEVTGWDFLAAINHHNSQMSKSVLAQFNDDQQGSGGDASLIDFGKQSDEMFLLMIRSIMNDIEDLVNNELMTRLVDWNFGSSKYPTWRFGELTDEQQALIVDTFNKVSTAGQSYLGTPDFVRKLEERLSEKLGLDVNYDSIANKEKDQLAQQQMVGTSSAPSTPADLPIPAGFQVSAPTDQTASPQPQDQQPQDVQLAGRIVKTQQGADYFGIPIGGVISPDKATKTTSPAIPHDAMPEPKDVLTHPNSNGEQLLDFGDGTLAIKFADGTMSPRQKFDIKKFEEMGWVRGHAEMGGKAPTQKEIRKDQLGKG